ncbi:MAG TPA: hypothetical protein DCX53_05835, partial [Anaerolineae bacterium]|nr:hypothetical protein [Anaerolineae bacterium]
MASMVASLLALTPASPAYAATLTVNTLVDENDGSCLDGDCSLRDALGVADPGDTIDFSVTGTILLTSQLAITQPVWIVGPGSNLLTIDGDETYRVFYMNSGAINVDISGMKITGGYAIADGGGGIYSAGALLSLDEVIIQDNTVNLQYGNGGGVFANTGSLTVTNSLVTENHSDHGSGVSCNTCILSISDTEISNNDDIDSHDAYTYGGGLYIVNTASATLTRVTISGNTAGAAGGVYISDSTVTIEESAIFNNTTDTEEAGGGLYINNPSGDTVTVKNSTISSNTNTHASGSGGGIFIPFGTLNLNNVTIAGNTVQGLFGGGGIVSFGTVNLQNTIIADNVSAYEFNSDDDCRGTINSLDYNLIENVSSNCTVTGVTTNNITGQDPALNYLALINSTYVHSLQTISLAIDAGNDGACETIDQRGTIRPIGPSCDIGAYEYENANPIVFNTNSSGVDSLRFAVQHLPTGGGTVTFDPSLAGQTILLGSPITFTKDTVVDGSALDPFVTVSGGGDRIVVVDSGINVTLQGLNLEDGFASDTDGGLGGAIQNYGDLM